ncbi:MAG: zinc finger domain-containing protein, partial [Bacillota bacterium]
AENRPNGEKVLPALEIPELAVGVRRAPGEKCVRCWKYSEGVGKNTEHPALCPRCAEVVRNWEPGVGEG